MSSKCFLIQGTTKDLIDTNDDNSTIQSSQSLVQLMNYDFYIKTREKELNDK